jgi:DNA-binding cell septation regulator SpoVG
MENLVSSVRFTSASLHDMRRGLVGYTTFVLNGDVRIDGVAVRRSQQGRLYLAFPARRDSLGIDHPLVQPLGNEVRRQIERQVLAALPFLEGSGT